MGGAVFPPCYLSGAKLWWPGQNTGVDSLSLLQGSSQPRDQTQASHIAGRFFTSWATGEALNYDGDNEDNGDFLQKVPWRHCYTQCSQPCSRPPPTHASTRDSWTLTGKSGSVSCEVTAPFSWVLVYTRLFVPSKSLFPQTCVSSGGSMVGLMATSSKRTYAIPNTLFSIIYHIILLYFSLMADEFNRVIKT